MNVSNIRQYLISGLDPGITQIVDTPYMSTLQNWIPSSQGLTRATKLPYAYDAEFNSLTGRAIAPFGEVRTYANSRTILDLSSTSSSHYSNHKLCCTSNHMVFFAGASSLLTMTDIGAKLYTPHANHLFWCGAFNEGMGIALKSDSMLQMQSGDIGLDHWQDLTCGYKAFNSPILGLHPMTGGAVLVCTEGGLYRIFPMDFERFTFGEELISLDVCHVPMSINCTNPVVVNAIGEVLLITSEGIQKLGYSQSLAGKTIVRVTYDSYRNTYYLCTSSETYILNETGMWVLGQTIQAKTDQLSLASNIATLPESIAETTPFTMGMEGIKSLKGVLLHYTGDTQVSFGFREQQGEPLQYTPYIQPDTRGAVNKVVTGYEFTVRMRSTTPTIISNIDLMWSNAIKTNFSQVTRRL